MKDILTRLESGEVIVADGAMGTMLLESGVPAGLSPEGLLLEAPDKVRVVHRAYVDAGAELILTCTFGGTRTRLARGGLEDRIAEINRQAVAVAREAAGDKAFVAGDIGPLGEFLAPLGKITFEQAVAIFAEQAQLLAECGVDVLYIETMSDANELIAAVEGAKQVSGGIPIFATLSFDSHGKTNMGVSPERAAQVLAERGVAAMGANCGAALEMTREAVAKMGEVAPGIPLIAKPNAGKPQMVGREVVYDASPEDMARYALQFIVAGARVVGGCCGSTPEHIAAISRAVKAN
jgi:5-methyltetrahydrofolate--homocysteine methyltransferase